MRRPLVSSCLLAAALLWAAALPNGSLRAAQAPTFVSHSDLVVLRVNVRDRKGEAIAGLTRYDFAVYEDGRPQTISVFSSEDLPVTAGLVIDGSSSMAAKHEPVVEAGLAFARLSRADDEFFTVDFNEHVRDGLPPDAPFTSDHGVLRGALLGMRANGKTAMYDAVGHALEYLTRGHHDQKALIVVSDGLDTASALKLPDLTNLAARSRAVIYTVGLFAKGDLEANPGVLTHLADMSGGRAFFPTGLTEVVGDLEQIARDIRTSYTLGYIPADAGKSARSRTLRVSVRGAAAGTRVRHRTGYVLPASATGSP